MIIVFLFILLQFSNVELWSYDLVNDTKFPYVCEYEDGQPNLTAWQSFVVEPYDFWLPFVRVTNTYYMQISNDEYFGQLLYLNPCELRVEECALYDGECLYQVSCDDLHTGLCIYNTEQNFCNAYDEICEENGCSRYSKAPSRRHHCQNSTSAYSSQYNTKFVSTLIQLYSTLLTNVTSTPTYLTPNEIFDDDSATTPFLNFTTESTENTLFTTEHITTKIEPDLCAKCDSIFSNYVSPAIQIAQYPLESTIKIKIIGHLKLKKILSDFPASCTSDISEPLNNDYFHTFGFFLGNYTLVNSTRESQIWNLTFYNPKLSLGRIKCEAFEYPSMHRIESNQLIFKPTEPGYDFAIEIKDYYLSSHLQISSRIKEAFSQYINYLKSIRPTELFPSSEIKCLHVIFHVTTYSNESSLNEAKDIMKQVMQLSKLNYTYIRSSEYCLSNTTSTENITLTWPLTNLNSASRPLEKCLHPNGTSVRRRCLGEFLTGAYWADFSEKCSFSAPSSNITDDLDDLLNSDKPAEEINIKLEETLQKTDKYVPADISLVANVMKKIISSDDHFDLTTLSKSLNTIMDADRITLKEAQKEMRATDDILKNFDEAVLKGIPLTKASNQPIVLENLIVKVFDLQKDTDLIVSFYQDGKMQMGNDGLEQINRVNLEFAVFVPRILINHIITSTTSAKLALIIYKNDNLFNEENQNAKTAGWIPSIFIPNFNSAKLPVPLEIIYKSSANLGNCSHWTFARENAAESGGWGADGPAENWHDFQKCDFEHMTHFGLLVGTPDSLGLTIVTLIGCCLSLIGIGCIFITAIVFKTWRAEDGTKVLLNISVVILLQMVLLYVGGERFEGESDQVCVFVGASLHYSVLAHSFWMLIIGFVQYQRLVVIFYKEPENFIIFSSLFGWILPIVIVLPIALTSPSSYAHETFCYLEGKFLYFGLFFPVGLVLITNLLFFSGIVQNIWFRNDQRIASRTDKKVQFKILVFLFFLMGFTWIFGLFSAIFQSEVLSYLFCISATLQGFALFLFCVALNEQTKRYWNSLIRRTTYKLQSTFTSTESTGTK